MNVLFDCRRCVERASELVDGELSWIASLVTRLHVLGCRDCRVHVDQLRTTLKVVHGSSPGATLPEDRRRAVLEALRRRRSGE